MQHSHKKELNTEIGGFLVGDKIMFKTKSSKLPLYLKQLPPGDYDVSIEVKPTSGAYSKGVIKKSGKVTIETGHVFIGDPGAVHSTLDSWYKFLEVHQYFKKPMKHGVFIDVGGDGKGVVEVKFNKVK